MKSLLIFIFQIAFFLINLIDSAHAQTAMQDSLKAALKNTRADTDRVFLLVKLSIEYEFKDRDTALFYVNSALEIAKKIGFTRGMAKSYTCLGYLDEDVGNYREAIMDHQKALDIYEQSSNRENIASALGNIGTIWWRQGDYPKALALYFKALKIEEDKENEREVNKRQIVTWLCNIGIVYASQKDYPKALEYNFKALSIAEKMEYKNILSNILGNIGGIYLSRGDLPGERKDYAKASPTERNQSFGRALEYYFKALKMAEESGDKSQQAMTLGNIGSVYSGRANSSASEARYGKADSLAAEVSSGYARALEYYFKALKIDKELGNKNGTSRDLGNIGTTCMKTGFLPEAEKYLLSAQALADSIGYLEAIKDWNKNLSELYTQMATRKPQQAIYWQKALAHQKRFSIANDSLFNQEKSKEIGKLETKHEYEMQEIKRKQEELERQRKLSEALGRRNVLQNTGILIFIALLGAGLMMAGKFKLPEKWAEGLIFFTFLLFFEFLLVLFDPYADKITGGEPALKLAINAAVALVIFPIHQFAEAMIKKRVLATKQPED